MSENDSCKACCQPGLERQIFFGTSNFTYTYERKVNICNNCVVKAHYGLIGHWSWRELRNAYFCYPHPIMEKE